MPWHLYDTYVEGLAEEMSGEQDASEGSVDDLRDLGINVEGMS